jgi:F-type H+-transporting ATPase subunit b
MMRRFGLILTLALALVLLPASRVLAQAEHEARPADAAAADAAHDAGNAPPGESAQAGHREHEVIEFDGATAAWVLIIFALLVVILSMTAWKNVLAGLKKREGRIRSDIAEAEAARSKAEATLREYNAQLAAAEERGRQILAAATTDAEKLATTIRMKAQQESEEIKERAQKDIEAARDTAMREFREYAAEVATSAAEKIIRRNLNAQDQQDLVRQSLDQLQTVK